MPIVCWFVCMSVYFNFGSYSGGFNSHILVLWDITATCIIVYTRHALVRYKSHILVGYNCNIPWSKFEKYWTPGIHDLTHDFLEVSFCIGAIIRTRREIQCLLYAGLFSVILLLKLLILMRLLRFEIYEK